MIKEEKFLGYAIQDPFYKLPVFGEEYIQISFTSDMAKNKKIHPSTKHCQDAEPNFTANLMLFSAHVHTDDQSGTHMKTLFTRNNCRSHRISEFETHEDTSMQLSDVEDSPHSEIDRSVCNSDLLSCQASPEKALEASNHISALNNSPYCDPCRLKAFSKVHLAKWYCSDCDEVLCHDCHSSHISREEGMHLKHHILRINKHCRYCEVQKDQPTSQWYCRNCQEYLCNRCRSIHKAFKVLVSEKHKVIYTHQKVRVKEKGPASVLTTVCDANNDLTLERTDNVKNKKVPPGKTAIVKSIRKPIKACKLNSDRKFNVQASEDRETPRIKCLSFLPDSRLLLVDDSNRKLKLFSCCFQFLTEKRFKTTPHALATYDVHELLLVFEGKRIIRFHIQDDKHPNITAKEYVPLNFECCDVDYICHDKIAATGIKPNMFCICNIEGTILYKVAVRGISDQSQPAPSLFVTIDRTRNRAYLSNLQPSTVCAFDLTSRSILFTCRYQDLRGLCGVVLDQEGCIYICGTRSNNIYQVTPEGQPIRLLLTRNDGLDFPAALALSPDQKYFVIGSSNDEKIVQLFSCI